MNETPQIVTVLFSPNCECKKISRYVGDTLSIRFCYNKLQMKSYLYGCLYHVFVPWRVAWNSDVDAKVSFPVARRIVLLMKLEMKNYKTEGCNNDHEVIAASITIWLKK